MNIINPEINLDGENDNISFIILGNLMLKK